MRFKLGDIVKVRSWKDMECEFGKNGNDDIPCHCDFVRPMEKYCGEFLIIRDVSVLGSGCYYLMNMDNIDVGYSWSDDMLENTAYQTINGEYVPKMKGA